VKPNFLGLGSQNNWLLPFFAGVSRRKQAVRAIEEQMVFKMLRPCGMILRSESRSRLAITGNSLTNCHVGRWKPGIARGVFPVARACKSALQARITGNANCSRRIKILNLAAESAVSGSEKAKRPHRLPIQCF